MAIEQAVAAAGDPDTTGADDAIVLRDVVRRYGEREALRKVNTSLPAGRTLAVFGPNTTSVVPAGTVRVTSWSATRSP